MQTSALPPWCRVLPDGLELRLRVQPGARRSAIVDEHGERLKASVAAPATAGRANDELRALLAELAGVPQRHVTLVAGAGSRDKRVHIAARADDLVPRLRSAMRR